MADDQNNELQQLLEKLKTGEPKPDPIHDQLNSGLRPARPALTLLAFAAVMIVIAAARWLWADALHALGAP
ncbi:hypothetical protein [Terrarubrum flagellatum]|uniref:hypothetical protein n=1 Tax=Terrirubrum flagellatum TaxID=2895980 RepID=UPI0031455D16